MARIDSDDASSGSGSTLDFSPSSGVLAKISNKTDSNGDLDESGHAPQRPIEKEIPLSEQQKHATTPSTMATHADDSLGPASSSSLPTQLLTGEGATSPEHLSSEIANLTKYLQRVSSQAAGQVLQKFWRKFLFSENGDEHLSWVLRAGIRNAPTPVIERILKDSTIVNILAPIASKKQPIATAVLADLPYDELLEYIPGSVLDRVIRQRLETMPAKPLIRWLAVAERLGFCEDDILDDEDESVMPNLAASDLHNPGPAIPGSYAAAPAKGAIVSTYVADKSDSGSGDIEILHSPQRKHNLSHHNNENSRAVQQHNAAPAPQSQYTVTAPPSSSSTNPLVCPFCRLVLPNDSGYNYHITKKICLIAPPPNGYRWSCQNCGRGFASKQGMNYHVNLANVCFGDNIAAATSPYSQPQSPQLEQQPMKSAVYPISQPNKQESALLPPPKSSSSVSQQPPSRNSQAEPPPVPQCSDQAHRHPAATAKIPRRPLQTPVPDRKHWPATQSNVTTGRQGPHPNESRISPAELSPSKFAQLSRALDDQEAKYQALCAEVDPNLGPREREARLQSLKNGHATRKSLIRRSFGVSLRMRDKIKAGRSVSLGTPSAGRNLEDYRANASVIGTTYLKESIPVRPSLSKPSSSFSLINAAENNTSKRGATSPENRVFRSPIEHHPNAYKRQKRNHSLSDQLSEQSTSVGTSERQVPQTTGSAKPNRGEARLTSSVKVQAESSNRASSSVGRATLVNSAPYIEIASTSEESGGDDMAGIPRPISPSSVSRRAASNGKQAAEVGAVGRSFERKSTAGSSRGIFTSKRGRR